MWLACIGLNRLFETIFAPIPNLEFIRLIFPNLFKLFRRTITEWTNRIYVVTSKIHRSLYRCSRYIEGFIWKASKNGVYICNRVVIATKTELKQEKFYQSFETPFGIISGWSMWRPQYERFYCVLKNSPKSFQLTGSFRTFFVFHTAFCEWSQIVTVKYN